MNKNEKDASKTNDAALLLAVANATRLLSPDVKAILQQREQAKTGKPPAPLGDRRYPGLTPGAEIITHDGNPAEIVMHTGQQPENTAPYIGDQHYQKNRSDGTEGT